MKEEFDITARALFDSLLEKSFERTASEDTDITAYYEPPLEGLDASELPLLEEEDRDILMHRDAHFGKNFQIMLEHYEEEGVGAVLDVDADRIAGLMNLESQLGQNLAPYLMQGADAEKVAQSIRMYQALREQIENKKEVPLVAAIGELILSEDDPEVTAEKAASYGKKLIPYLIQLIQTPVLYDPLFPGYGQSPVAACLTLGHLQATEAIKLLFGLIGTENFDTESAAIRALRLIGEPARTFCLQQLSSRPITKNNERAAIVASSLDCDDEMQEALLCQLEDKDVQRIESLTTYLVLAVSCISPHYRERFKNILQSLPESAQQEMRSLDLLE
ncbi:MAG: HEAT repeat domain-containing protein [Chlamydiales bacterium]|nr:HEAT repeat domain-containing protein [Chlamydiales bacterium]